MFSNKIILLAICSVCFAVNPIFSAGTNSLEFLNLGCGSRSIALAQASSAASGDPSSMFYNPAALATINEFKASFMFNEHVQNLHHSHIGAVLPLNLPNRATLGVGLYNLSIRNIPEYDHTGSRLNSVSAYTNMASLSYAQEVSYWLMLGASVKFVQEKLHTKDASTHMLDLGFWHPTAVPWLSIGGSLLNIGPGMKYENEKFPLPRTLRYGASYNLPYLNRSIILLAENSKVKNENSVFSAGVEVNTIPHISFRTGYSSLKKSGSKSSFGLGFLIGKIRLDYALAPFGNLGDSHSVTLEYLLEPVRKSARHQLKEEESEVLYNRAVQAYIREDEIEALKLLKRARKVYPANNKASNLQKEIAGSLYEKANSLYIKENKPDEAIAVLQPLTEHYPHRESKKLLKNILKERTE